MSAEITKAMRQLIAVTRPRPDQSEGSVTAMAERFAAVFQDYPERLVLAALHEWPKGSEWFPTERELRELLDRLRVKFGIAKGGGTGKGRSQTPVGVTKQFWERVSDVRGEAYAKAWLWPGVTAEFSTNNVYVNQVGHDRLWRDCESIIREFGVAIVIDNDVAKLLVQYMKDNNISEYEPKRRRA